MTQPRDKAKPGSCKSNWVWGTPAIYGNLWQFLAFIWQCLAIYKTIYGYKSIYGDFIFETHQILAILGKFYWGYMYYRGFMWGI
jgi:hypothetical protein